MSASWDVTSGPGVTALGLAAARSVETGRPDRLVEDPFARRLFEAAAADLPMRLDWPAPGQRVSDTEALHLHGSRYIGLRTRVYDDVLTAAIHDGIRQAVLLGSGLDTRAFRLELPPGLRLFEADQPGVLGFKAKVMEGVGARPGCDHRAVGVDFREDWLAALTAAGFDPGQPTAWIAEGLLPYLPARDTAGLIDAIHRSSASGSVLALDRVTGSPSADGRLADLSRRSGIDMQRLFADDAPPDPSGALEAHGWSVATEPVAIPAARYGRDLDNPFPGPAEPPWLDTAFVTARLPA